MFIPVTSLFSHLIYTLTHNYTANDTNKTLRRSLLNGAIISGSLSDPFGHIHETAIQNLLIPYIPNPLVIDRLIHLFLLIFPHLACIIYRVRAAHSLIFLV